jgi:hypothetical protein
LVVGTSSTSELTATTFGINVKRSNSIWFKSLVEIEISFSELPRLTPKPLSLEEITWWNYPRLVLP